MKTLKEQATEIVLLCKSNPTKLRKYVNEHWDEYSKELQLELYLRLINLQGHF